MISGAAGDVSAPALRRPAWIVFCTSGAIMVLELVVGRIAASYVGWSLYTWSAIISVVLAGIALGNLLGGRLADRWASRRLMAALICLGGVLSWGILALGRYEALVLDAEIGRGSLPLLAGLTGLALVLFALPCTVLGAVSPVVAKLAVRDLAQAGRTVGNIYAAGSGGGIVGTFAAGFVLISWLGTLTVIALVGALLTALGLAILMGHHWRWAVLSAVALLGGTAMAGSSGWLKGPCTRESNYYCIRVTDETHDGRPLRVLYLNRLLHSYSDLNDPKTLHYEYEQLYAEATQYQIARKGPIRALLIGGGGYTYPRYVEAVHPEVRLDVVEIDPEVTQVAHEMLGLARDTSAVTHNQDARLFVQGEPDQPYDLVLIDAFSDFSVPYHLTTHEFNQRARAWLADDGLLLANLIDGPQGEFVHAYIRTLRRTFKHVHPVVDLEIWRQRPRTTILVLASDAPIDRALLRRVAPAMEAQLVDEATVDAMLAQGRPLILTDRYAPVDQLLWPVFLDQLPQ